MDLACPRCAAAILAADVDLGSRHAKCRACNAVFDITPQLARGASAPLARRAPVPMPARIAIVEDAVGEPAEGDYRAAPAGRGRLVLARSWFSYTLFILLPFCLVWDAFLIVWYWIATRQPSAFSVVAVVVPIFHVAVGASLTYRVLTGFLNKTWITVTPDALTVRHAPLPWRGNRVVPASELQQLFCEQVAQQSKNGVSYTYNLSAMLRDGSKIELLKELPSADQALFLEQRIEERLGIEDAPVGGEYRG